MFTGHFEGEAPSSVTLYYETDGVNKIEEIDVDSTGTFIYNPELPSDKADLIIVSGKDVFGARIENGKSINATINGENISFTGDNVSISDFLSAYHTAYNYMTFKVKPDQIEAGYNFDNDKAKLDAGADKASNLLNAVPAEEREYYTALNQAGYDYTYLSILSSDHYLNGNNRTAEMNEIAARINPDSDEARVSGLLSMWMRTDSAFNVRTMEYRDSVGPTVAQIWAIDASLNNQANKNSLYSSVANMFMFYNPSDEEIEKFFVLVKPQLDKAPA
ncbi:MAG: hypothetical protein K2J94_00300, partial [Duncaniella sp.]|nr:hypothetical protein [Duncaniella sp.]